MILQYSHILPRIQFCLHRHYGFSTIPSLYLLFFSNTLDCQRSCITSKFLHTLYITAPFIKSFQRFLRSQFILPSPSSFIAGPFLFHRWSAADGSERPRQRRQSDTAQPLSSEGKVHDEVVKLCELPLQTQSRKKLALSLNARGSFVTPGE